MANSLFRGHSGALFREVTFSIFDQRDGEKDDVTMVKKTKYVFQKMAQMA